MNETAPNAEEQPRPDWARFVILAWSSAGVAFAKMIPLFLSAAVLYVMFGVADRWIMDGLTSISDNWPHAALVLAFGAIGLLEMAIDALLLAPVAVAVHRFVLLEEVSPGFTVLRQPCIGNFVIWTFWLEVALNAVDLFEALADNWFIGVLGTVALFVLFARTLLIFPAVAIDVPAVSASDRIEASLSSSRGLFWATVFTVIMAILPLGLIEFAAVFLDFLHLMQPNWTGVPQFDALLISAVLGDFVHPLLAGVLAAVASWIYLWARDHPREPPLLPLPH